MVDWGEKFPNQDFGGRRRAATRAGTPFFPPAGGEVDGVEEIAVRERHGVGEIEVGTAWAAAIRRRCSA